MTTDEQIERCGPPVAVIRNKYLGKIRFELRPIANEPPDNTVAIMYRRTGDPESKAYSQSGVGIFKNGAWRKSGGGKPIEGDYLWAAMVSD